MDAGAAPTGVGFVVVDGAMLLLIDGTVVVDMGSGDNDDDQVPSPDDSETIVQSYCHTCWKSTHQSPTDVYESQDVPEDAKH